MGTPINRERVDELTEQELTKLIERTPNSKKRWEEASTHLSSGVASSYQLIEPYPISIERGHGPRIWDVDGHEYIDYMNGFGAMIQGHSNPVIGEAIAERFPLGTHFGAPSGDAAIVAKELGRRFGLPKWRFTNSGSESTMDAIRIARAMTGRDTVMKIFGSYHGHHDAVMVSVGSAGMDDPEIRGTRDNYASISYGGGIPQSIVDMTVAVPFNDAEAMERRIEELANEGRKPACVIMEAAMMNLGVVFPLPGYLEKVREITRKHGIVLIFDEVKTGLLIAAGGATEKFGVTPDILTISKALAGGLPSGAVGMTEEASKLVESGEVNQVGTYNGNPLTIAAARANLFEVLTDDAYAHLAHLNDRILAGCNEVIAKYDLIAHTVGIGAKGCIVFSDTPVTDYESYFVSAEAMELTTALTTLAWLFNVNRGVFMAPGREEEWTLSVTHGDAEVDRYVEVFDELAAALRA
ncbi:aspartate aminotransferase family protein [Leucobacter denitrificans]|uniref:Aspartate aminotransferase family protein n=1 Tax=Leucobacter denitrificans TaxID=683042 RepID=A0A7G9S287_9MICO|nr:aspartate aminotransferase family protein [Leucobacter denitrificans]QNN61962.1 aspartate aminotransferase family protein [Leucobacter denitrificans]